MYTTDYNTVGELLARDILPNLSAAAQPAPVIMVVTTNSPATATPLARRPPRPSPRYAFDSRRRYWKRCLHELLMRAAANPNYSLRPPSIKLEIHPWFMANVPPSIPCGWRTLTRDRDKFLASGEFSGNNTYADSDLIWAWRGFSDATFLTALSSGRLPLLTSIIKKLKS